MTIREARMEDASVIAALLKQLDFERSVEFIEEKIRRTKDNADYRNLLAEQDGVVLALMTIHFWDQIGLDGRTCTISFFVVDEAVRSAGIGKLMEEYCTALAKENGCFNIELYSSEKRLDAHRFYERQGYKQYEKFFMKELR